MRASIRITAAVAPGGHLQWSVGEGGWNFVKFYVHPPPPAAAEGEDGMRGVVWGGIQFRKGKGSVSLGVGIHYGYTADFVGECIIYCTSWYMRCTSCVMLVSFN